MMMSFPQSRKDLDFMVMQLRASRLGPIFELMFKDAHWQIEHESNRLGGYEADLIIAIPIASSSSIKNSIDNLERLDLPLRTGVLLVLDRISSIESQWLTDLYATIYRLGKSGRFVFVEAIHTTNTPVKDLLPKEAVQKIDDETVKKLASVGYQVKGASWGVSYYTVREQARLIIKYMQCKYVLWIDADTQPPKDTIGKLLKPIEDNQQVGMATGWYLDRHLPFECASFDTISQSESMSEEERQYYEQSYTRIEELRSLAVAIGPTGAKIPWQGYLMDPNRIRKTSKPFEIAYTGFGCVLLRKEIIDSCSHLSIHDGYMWSEDLTACIGARKAGYKVMVDPTCYCEHIG